MKGNCRESYRAKVAISLSVMMNYSFGSLRVTCHTSGILYNKFPRHFCRCLNLAVIAHL